MYGWDNYLMLAFLWGITRTPYGMHLASIGGTGTLSWSPHNSCTQCMPSTPHPLQRNTPEQTNT